MALAIKAIVSRGVRANGVQEQGCAVPRLKLSADNGYVLHQSENISSAPMQRYLLPKGRIPLSHSAFFENHKGF